MSYLLSIALMTFASLLAALGQLNLKMGAMKLKLKIPDLLRNYMLIAGFLFYGLSIIISVIALRGNELSVLYPIASLNYVWVSFLSMKYLNERMNVLKWTGIALIIIGVVVIL